MQATSTINIKTNVLQVVDSHKLTNIWTTIRWIKPQRLVITTLHQKTHPLRITFDLNVLIFVGMCGASSTTLNASKMARVGLRMTEKQPKTKLEMLAGLFLQTGLGCLQLRVQVRIQIFLWTRDQIRVCTVAADQVWLQVCIVGFDQVRIKC